MSPDKSTNTPERQRQLWLDFKDRIFDSNKGAVEMASVALKAALFINGAAAIALLAFIGQAATKNPEMAMVVAKLVDPMSLLVLGVLASALATGLGYLRMYFEGLFYHREIKAEGSGKYWLRVGNAVQDIAIFLVFATYILFAVAMFQTTAVIRDSLKNPHTEEVTNRTLKAPCSMTLVEFLRLSESKQNVVAPYARKVCQ